MDVMLGGRTAVPVAVGGGTRVTRRVVREVGEVVSMVRRSMSSWQNNEGWAISDCTARKRVDKPYESIATSIIGRTCKPYASQSKTERSPTPKAKTRVDSAITAAASSSPGLPWTPTTPIASGCDSSTAPLASRRVTTGAPSTSASSNTVLPTSRASKPSAITTRSSGLDTCAATSSRMPVWICESSRRLRMPIAEHRCSGAWICMPWMSTGTATWTHTRCVSAIATASRINATSCSGSLTVTEYARPPAAKMRAWSMS
mmetsp:Transcript_8099/g.15156  ORF Transcript_8099/g.15156 Transcript_8099/m.15156 type:complete len:259 (+) Transcript_8099:351-1127(+)